MRNNIFMYMLLGCCHAFGLRISNKGQWFPISFKGLKSNCQISSGTFLFHFHNLEKKEDFSLFLGKTHY